jgi:signal transduction histidine kinase
MRTVQRASGADTAAKHARFLSNVSRHMIALDLEPMLEAVAHASLPLLGDACVVDRLAGGAPTRLLDVRIRQDTRIEPAEDLAGVSRAEIRLDGARSRLTVPIVIGGERFGSLTFMARSGLIHGAAELALAQQLAERLALAIHNIQIHTQLRESVAERERLISVAAHELRGPICSLRLCMQALRRSERKRNAERKADTHGSRLMDIMDREERRLARLIDDLLDVARVRSGQLQLDLEYVDLCGLVRDVTSRMKLEAERAGSHLQVSVTSALVGHWDRARLDQVVTNLVGNAIKFGEQRPISITVAGAEDGSSARLRVTDRGVGIDPEQQQQIFEPFKRAVGPNRYQGLGLGLYIVRNIVKQLGGNVSVESVPGAGASFMVELPLAAEPQRIRATGS